MDKNILENQLPIEIDYNIRENDAPNKEHINQNYLFIVNGDKISPRLKAPLKKDDYFGREQIALSVKLPRDTAKEVAPNLAVVCGVKFLDYTRSVDGSYINKRTISDPTEHYYLVNCIDAELVSLHLINQESKQQLIKWTP